MKIKRGVIMSIAETLYLATRELPEPMQSELLDFAEFLRQRKSPDGRHPGNIAQRIHQRFKNLEGDGLPISARQLSRIPLQMEC
jgi:hypothetical protein